MKSLKFIGDIDQYLTEEEKKQLDEDFKMHEEYAEIKIKEHEKKNNQESD